MYGLELGQKCDLSWSPSEEKKTLGKSKSYAKL